MTPEAEKYGNVVPLLRMNPDFELEHQQTPIVEYKGPPHHDGIMRERIARLEGDVAGGKRVEFAMLAIGGLILAVLAIATTILIYQNQETRTSLSTRMDRIEAGQQRLEDQMRGLPAELRGIADSITSAITATQSGQPQVIVIERPPAEPQPPEE